MTVGISRVAGVPSFQAWPQVRLQGNLSFTPRFGDSTSPEQPEPRRRKLNMLQKAGLAVATLGFALSLGLSAKANIDYDGKFNLIPATAEEKHQQGVASIPGILVLGLGSLLVNLGKGRREDGPEAGK